jgi:hypothetical protein
MSYGEIAMLAVIVGAFTAFSVTLFWVSLTDGTGLRDADRRPERQGNARGSYPTDAGLIVDD